MAAFCHVCRRAIGQGDLGVEGDHAYHRVCLEGLVRTYGLAEARRMNPTPLEQEQAIVIAELKAQLSLATADAAERKVIIDRLERRVREAAEREGRTLVEHREARARLRREHGDQVAAMQRQIDELAARSRLPARPVVQAAPAATAAAGDPPPTADERERFALLEID